MTIRAALFDIDGTLVDSNYLHIDAWARAFDDVGHPVDAWRIHRSIGMDGEKLLDSLLEGADAQTRKRASEAHSTHYGPSTERLRAFAGARELLRELAARGVTVVLATSAPEAELAALRATLSLDDAVDVVTSSEDVDTAKPSPDIVRVALERAAVEPNQAVMIGDSVWDVQAARRAGGRLHRRPDRGCVSSRTARSRRSRGVCECRRTARRSRWQRARCRGLIG